MATKIVVSIIKLYQLFFSPDKGMLFPQKVRTCRFFPSCSVYTIMALEKYGFFDGLLRGTKRVLHCHPWQKGGYDPVS